MVDTTVRKALLLAKTIRHTKWYAMGPNQRTLLQKWTDALQERADTPVAENTHYTRCVWSYPFCECGPDTCYCSRTAFIIMHLEELSTELQNIPVRVATLRHATPLRPATYTTKVAPHCASIRSDMTDKTVQCGAAFIPPPFYD